MTELEGSAPGSEVSWPVNRIPWAEIEMHARMGELIQADLTSPYAPYDAWLEAHCGPGGYARAGDTVGIGDQASAEEFLRWIHPAEIDTKLGLARMITRVRPARIIVDRIIKTIGDELIAISGAQQVAELIERIYVHIQEVESCAEREIISEIADWYEMRMATHQIKCCE